MARRHRKTIGQILSDNKKRAVKAALDRDMHYCSKCGWGWDPIEGHICPKCGTDVNAPPAEITEEPEEGENN